MAQQQNFEDMVDKFHTWLKANYKNPRVSGRKADYSNDVQMTMVYLANRLNRTYKLANCPPGTTHCTEGCCDDLTYTF